MLSARGGRGFIGRSGLRHFLPSFGGTEMIQSRVARDRKKPVDDRPASIEAMHVFVRFDECLLDQIFSVLPLTSHLVNEIENARGVQADDLIEILCASTRIHLRDR